MKKLPYIPYSGQESCAFFGWSGDCPEAVQTAEALIRRTVRLYWDDGTGAPGAVSEALAAACVCVLPDGGGMPQQGISQ